MLVAACGLACALVLATPAAALDVGANDDAGKYSTDPAAFFARMAGLGMKQNVMTVRWTPGAEDTAEAELLAAAIPAAVAQGVQPVLAVYPYPPSAIEAGAADPEAFAAWLGRLADAFPQVRTFIVGNEPNLNTFWRPQGDGAGTILSAAAFGPFLAAGYDALKPRGLTVVGVGLSPRGDLRPAAAGKTAPVVWLKALGEWYRDSGRDEPLMDGFSYHPYPNPSDFTVPLTFSYSWPNAGVQELDRIKQALHDAFDGTAQPRVPLYLDEIGWQVDTAEQPGYSGSENVRVTTEAAQAAIYGDAVRLVACDADVAQLNFFGFQDDPLREGWQAGTHRADGTPRASADTVRAAIPQGCTGWGSSWRPRRSVIGATADFLDAGKAHPAGHRLWAVVTTADEQYGYAAGVFPAGTTVAQAARELAAEGAVTRGIGRARFVRRIEVRRSLLPGRYVTAVRLAAWANPERATTLVGRPFRVGNGTAGLRVVSAGPLDALLEAPITFRAALRELKSVATLPAATCSGGCAMTAELVPIDRTAAVARATPPRTLRASVRLLPGEPGRPRFRLRGVHAGTYRLSVTVTAGTRKATAKIPRVMLDGAGRVLPTAPAGPAKR